MFGLRPNKEQAAHDDPSFSKFGVSHYSRSAVVLIQGYQDWNEALAGQIVGRLVAEVGVVEVGVVTALVHQDVVAALFDDAPMAQDDDAVGVADGREAVGDEDGGAILEQEVQPFLNLRLGERVNAGVASSRMMIEGSCSSTRARATSWRWPIERALPCFAHLCLQAIGQSIEPVAIADLLCHCVDLRIGGFGAGIADVVGHRAREEERDLRHNAQLAVVGLQIEGADIVSIDEECPPWNS